MTDKEILENARLLATFLGYIEKNDELFMEDSDEGTFYKHKFFLKDSKFHYSYDWLMPVITKLFNEGWVTVFYSNYCIIKDIDVFTKREDNDLPFFESHSKSHETLIEAVYECVIECINWNNQNK